MINWKEKGRRCSKHSEWSGTNQVHRSIEREKEFREQLKNERKGAASGCISVETVCKMRSWLKWKPFLFSAIFHHEGVVEFFIKSARLPLSHPRPELLLHSYGKRLHLHLGLRSPLHFALAMEPLAVAISNCETHHNFICRSCGTNIVRCQPLIACPASPHRQTPHRQIWASLTPHMEANKRCEMNKIQEKLIQMTSFSVNGMWRTNTYSGSFPSY